MLRNSHPSTIHCVEFVSLTGLAQVINSCGGISDQVLELLDRIEPVRDSDLAVVRHSWKKGNGAPYGRYYSSGSLIRQRRSHRGVLARCRYFELDIRASNPTLLYNLMVHHGQRMPALEFYVSNRSQCEEQMLAEIPIELRSICFQGEPLTMKRFVNAALNGSTEMWSVLRPAVSPDGVIANLKKEFDACLSFIYEKYDSIPVNMSSANPRASRLTNVLLTLEADIMIGVMNALLDHGLLINDGTHVDVGLAYDGLLVPRRGHDHEAQCITVANDVIRNMGYCHLVMRPKELDMPVPGALPSIVDSVEYLSNLADMPQDKLLVRAPTGSGKTSAAVSYALSTFSRVLVIVHRQMLAHDLKAKYPQFDCYLHSGDDERSLDGDLQIICLNSLDKLKDPTKYECVICDELSSVMWQLVEMRVSNISIEIFGVFATKPGIKFIGLDALLCEQDAQFWFEEYAARGLDSDFAHYVTPARIATPTKECILFDDMRDLKIDMLNSINSGRTICVAYSTSIDKMNGLLESTGVPFLNVNRYTKEDVSIADWMNYQIVAFSPTMDAGVDVSFLNGTGERVQHFDVVYGIFNKGNTMPKQAVQMLGRVRDCTDFRISITGNCTDRMFDNQCEFDEFVKNRLDYIKQFNLEAQLNMDFSATVLHNFRYRLTYNAVAHRKEHKNYLRHLKKYLLMNQWRLSTIRDEEKPDIDVGKLEKEGVIREMLAIAKARVVDASEYNKDNMTLESYREYMAWTINRVFGMEDLRPPPPRGIFDGGSRREIDLYNRVLQEKQLLDLYPFDGNGVEIGFNYIAEYRRTKEFYYRALQLIALENDDNQQVFTFVLQQETFKEKTYHVRRLLGMIGFEKLADSPFSVNYAAVQQSPYFKLILNGSTPKQYLQDVAGLTVEKLGSEHRLGTRYISSDPSTPGAYYIANSPFLFTGTSNMRAVGREFECPECGKRLSRNRAADHVCRDLPPGFCYARVEGRMRKLCQLCNVVVDRNLKRHCDRNH